MPTATLGVGFGMCFATGRDSLYETKSFLMEEARMHLFRLASVAALALTLAGGILNAQGRPETTPVGPPSTPVEKPATPPANPPDSLIEFVCSILPVPNLCDAE
jgi:hypothetical protein